MWFMWIRHEYKVIRVRRYCHLQKGDIAIYRKMVVGWLKSFTEMLEEDDW